MSDNLQPWQNLLLSQITASRTNPRKRFPEIMINELSESIKKVGVLQPILVRPLPDGKNDQFEIVAGECRWRAAKQAEVTSIPAVVKELNDLEALELQVLENLHRNDLHPMEEAEGFDALLKKSQDLIGYTVDELALKIGKSRSYVYGSLKLIELCTYARDAFYDGKLSQSTALLIARIPGEALQTQAIKEITGYQGEPLSYRAAKEVIQRRFTLNLNQAIFINSDTELVPQIPSCQECPKRSGNCPEICADINSADVCTDPNCYGMKKQAYIQRLIETEPNVITGEDAEKIMKYGTYYMKDHGYILATEEANISENEEASYAEIFGEDLAPTIIITEGRGPITCYRNEDIERLMVVKGLHKKDEDLDDKKNAENEAKIKLEVETARNKSKNLLIKLNSIACSENNKTIHRHLLEWLCLSTYSYYMNGHNEDKLEILFSLFDEKLDESSLDPLDDLIEARSIPELIWLLTAKDAIAHISYVNPWNYKDQPKALFQLSALFDVDPLEFYVETAPNPSLAAHAEENIAAKKIDEVIPPAAPADEPTAPEKTLPDGFENAKKLALARKARKDSKKVSAAADVSKAPASMAVETERA